ncbi:MULTISPECIES: hypothetical protein [unclassified Bartonella]
MFIKKSLFRSVLIIALLITSLISPSNGYANTKELFCSKEIIEREKAYHMHLYNTDYWWETKFYEILWIEKMYFLKKIWLLPKPMFEKHVKITRKWHDLIKKRNNISRLLISSMDSEIAKMKELDKERQSKKHEKVSRLLEIITEVQMRIATQKEKIKELDHEIKVLFDIISDFYR